jgi:MFS family permease
VTAALLPCPRCRRRSRAAIVQFTLATALGVLALGAVAAVAWWIQVGFWRWATTFAVLAGAGLLVRTKRKRFAETESLVEGVRVRVQLPTAAVVKLGPPPTPVAVASRAPALAPAVEDIDPSAPPKLLG